jgi:hypothetical protein
MGIINDTVNSVFNYIQTNVNTFITDDKVELFKLGDVIPFEKQMIRFSMYLDSGLNNMVNVYTDVADLTISMFVEVPNSYNINERLINLLDSFFELQRNDLSWGSQNILKGFISHFEAVTADNSNKGGVLMMTLNVELQH